MNRFTLLLCALYVTNIIDAASSSSQHSRRKLQTTMPLQQYVQFVHEKEQKEILKQLTKSEQTPCKTLADFRKLQSLYQAAEKFLEDGDLQSLQERSKQCDKRTQLMYDVESVERYAITKPYQDRTLKLLEFECAQLGIEQKCIDRLRDTYEKTSQHYIFYHHKRNEVQARIKQVELEQDVTLFTREVNSVLQKTKITRADYLQLWESAEQAFGNRIHEALNQLPGFHKVALRSVIEDQQSNGVSSSENTTQSHDETETSKHQNLFKGTKKRIEFYTNDTIFQKTIRMLRLRELYQDLMNKADEKEHAEQAIHFYNKKIEQALLEEQIEQLAQGPKDLTNRSKLKENLIALRDTFSPLDHGAYAQYSRHIELVDREIAYLNSNIDMLIDKAEKDTDIELKRKTEVMILRLEILHQIYISETLQEKRNLLLELMSTYDHDDPEHDMLCNKIARYDLMTKLDEIESEDLNDSTYYSSRHNLTQLLIETYSEKSAKRIDLHNCL